MYRTIGQQILFIYKTEAIIDRLKMYSGYPVRSMVETEKTPINKAELIITGDELKLIYSECERAISHIFQIAYKLSKNIPDSLLKNRSITLSIDVADEGLPDDFTNPKAPVLEQITVYGFRLANKLGYNINLLPMIDTAIEELLVSMVMLKWFTITRQFDFVKLEQGNIPGLMVQFNNSLTELYKPLIQYFNILPEFQQEIITINPETGTITDTTTGETGYTPPDQTTIQEVLYYAARSLFPAIGVVDMIYVDRAAKLMYSWDGTTYVLYTSPVGTFQLDFYDSSYVIAEHGLGKYMPTVQMIDAAGDEWDIDTEPVDVNITICQWNGNKTGTLYFS